MLHNTRPFNAFGLRAISVPCGFTRAGLPLGMQITAQRAVRQRFCGLPTRMSRRPSGTSVKRISRQTVPGPDEVSTFSTTVQPSEQIQ